MFRYWLRWTHLIVLYLVIRTYISSLMAEFISCDFFFFFVGHFPVLFFFLCCFCITVLYSWTPLKWVISEWCGFWVMRLTSARSVFGKRTHSPATQSNNLCNPSNRLITECNAKKANKKKKREKKIEEKLSIALWPEF